MKSYAKHNFSSNTTLQEESWRNTIYEIYVRTSQQMIMRAIEFEIETIWGAKCILESAIRERLTLLLAQHNWNEYSDVGCMMALSFVHWRKWSHYPGDGEHLAGKKFFMALAPEAMMA